MTSEGYPYQQNAAWAGSAEPPPPGVTSWPAQTTQTAATNQQSAQQYPYPYSGYSYPSYDYMAMYGMAAQQQQQQQSQQASAQMYAQVTPEQQQQYQYWYQQQAAAAASAAAGATSAAYTYPTGYYAYSIPTATTTAQTTATTGKLPTAQTQQAAAPTAAKKETAVASSAGQTESKPSAEGTEEVEGKKKKKKKKAGAAVLAIQQAQTAAQNAAPAPKQSLASSASGTWPSKLRSFVERCFAQCTADTDRKATEKYLTGLINSASSSNTLWTRDWDAEKIPSLADLHNPSAASATAKTTTASGSASASLPSSVPALVLPSATGGATGKGGSSVVEKVQAAKRKIEAAFEAKAKAKAKKKKEEDKQKEKQKEKEKEQEAEPVTEEERLRRTQRASRFKEKDQRMESRRATMPIYSAASASGEGDEDEGEWEPIKGYSTALEKPYLRLTSAPDPANVRPLEVLKESVKMLKQRWKANREYNYVSSQFKSVRQDLTVQHIRNEFTVEVYEIHARLALENRDLGEFNQCQTRLKELYASGLAGHRMEFVAYRLLYLIYHSKYRDIAQELEFLSDEERADPVVSHACKVASAVSTFNYHRFFQLYKDSPNMGAYLMDLMLQNTRKRALQQMARALQPTIPVDFVFDTFAFDTREEMGKFFSDQKIVLSDDEKSIDCRATTAAQT